MSVPVYVTTEQVLDRVAARHQMSAAKFEQQAPRWRDICQDAALDASLFVHKRVLAVLGTSAAVQQDAGIRRWAVQVGLCFALREGGLTTNSDEKKVEDYCQCLNEGDHWIPLTPTAELGTTLVVTSGDRDTSQDRFSLDMPS